METAYTTINLAGLVVDVAIDNSFEKIREFIDKFRDNTSRNDEAKIKINFKRDPERKIKLSEDWKSLLIAGNDIDDLSNPFNLIGITQALFRFSAVHLVPKGVFLLHGSTAILDSKIICFGDDGTSTAKTLGSLEIALDSKNYVADEFCFFDTQSKKVFGYQFIPIHIRPVVKEHLENYHGFSMPKSCYKKTPAGEFVEQDELFTTMSGKLSALVYIHFSKKNQMIEMLPEQEALKAFKFCMP